MDLVYEAKTKRTCYLAHMDEGRKRVLLIAASILAAPKLAQFETGRRVRATISATLVLCDGIVRQLTNARSRDRDCRLLLT